MSDRLVYFVCTSSRSGSGWLCDMLRATGSAGDPREFRLKHNPAAEWIERRQENPCGVKVARQAFRNLRPILTAAETVTAKYIFLYRQGTLRQAISKYRAQRSGVWQVTRHQEIPDEHREVLFQPRTIRKIHALAIKQNQRWRKWFRDMAIRPLEIVYEDFCKDPERTVREVLTFLEIPYDGPIVIDGLQVLSDDLTEEWVRALTRP